MTFEEVTTAVGQIFSDIISVGELVWGLFTDFLGMITGNPIIFVPVLLAILAGAVGIAIKVVRRFGVRGLKR